jgi:predicted Fe-Mo cluster-binding NifX family protein
MRDRQLVMQGHKVEWVLEKGGSKEMIKALNNAGIKVHIGSQIK